MECSKENFKSISERLEYIINVMGNYSYPSHKNYSDLMRIWGKIATEAKSILILNFFVIKVK